MCHDLSLHFCFFFFLFIKHTISSTTENVNTLSSNSIDAAAAATSFFFYAIKVYKPRKSVTLAHFLLIKEHDEDVYTKFSIRVNKKGLRRGKKSPNLPLDWKIGLK